MDEIFYGAPLLISTDSEQVFYGRPDAYLVTPILRTLELNQTSMRRNIKKVSGSPYILGVVGLDYREVIVHDGNPMLFPRNSGPAIRLI